MSILAAFDLVTWPLSASSSIAHTASDWIPPPIYRIGRSTCITRGQSNLTKGRIVAPKIHDRSALTKPEVVFLKWPSSLWFTWNNPRPSMTNRYGDINYFRWWSSAILVFLHSGNFGGRWRPAVQYASKCQISSRSVKPLRRYRVLSISPCLLYTSDAADE